MRQVPGATVGDIAATIGEVSKSAATAKQQGTATREIARNISQAATVTQQAATSRSQVDPFLAVAKAALLPQCRRLQTESHGDRSKSAVTRPADSAAATQNDGDLSQRIGQNGWRLCA